MRIGYRLTAQKSDCCLPPTICHMAPLGREPSDPERRSESDGYVMRADAGRPVRLLNNPLKEPQRSHVTRHPRRQSASSRPDNLAMNAWRALPFAKWRPVTHVRCTPTGPSGFLPSAGPPFATAATELAMCCTPTACRSCRAKASATPPATAAPHLRTNPWTTQPARLARELGQRFGDDAYAGVECPNWARPSFVPALASTRKSATTMPNILPFG